MLCDILSRSFLPDTQMLKENHTQKLFSKAASRTQILENFSMPIALWFDVMFAEHKRKENRNDKTCSSLSMLFCSFSPLSPHITSQPSDRVEGTRGSFFLLVFFFFIIIPVPSFFLSFLWNNCSVCVLFNASLLYLSILYLVRNFLCRGRRNVFSDRS